MQPAGDALLAAEAPAVNQPARWEFIRAAAYVILGTAMTLSLTGYQFGESNHAVYLLAALRVNEPSILANDWWVNSTLQYHVLFTRLCALLMRWNVIQPAFLISYLALAVLLHVAWRNIARALGASDGAYLFSVVLYYLLAGGLGLGVYRFLQDACFLPSNVSNVALLWAIFFYMTGRLGAAGLCVGIAGAFHLNYALVGIGAYGALAACALACGGISVLRHRAAWIGAALAVGLSCIAIVPALPTILRRNEGGLPLSEFVDLYVRLRHPHHYDPASWHGALWLSFLLPLPAFYFLCRHGAQADAKRRVAHIFLLCLALLLIAGIGAGIWIFSPALVQMSLWRFSIYPKLLSCIALAWVIWDGPRSARIAISILMTLSFCAWLMWGLSGLTKVISPDLVAANYIGIAVFQLIAMFAGCVARVRMPSHAAAIGMFCALLGSIAIYWQWDHLGLKFPGLEGDDAAYLSAVDWARQHTPRDAVFLVPPDEESFRLRGRRAIVVNFKNVPQLSAELPAWRDRLGDVLGMDDLRTLARPMPRTLADLRERYTKQSGEHLLNVARKYDARYLLATRKLDDELHASPVWRDSSRGYFLYDLAGLLAQRSQPTP